MASGYMEYSTFAMHRPSSNLHHRTYNKCIPFHQTLAAAMAKSHTPLFHLAVAASRGVRLSERQLCRSPGPAAMTACATVAEVGEEAPRPELIEWHKDLANSVNLIGIVWRDLEVKHLDSGKVLASTSLRVKRISATPNKEHMWFLVQFWDEMARIAAAHVKKEDCIYVSGNVYVENFMGSDNVQKTLCKVIARDLKFVESGKANKGETFDTTESLEKKWKDVFENPSEWWDNRSNKINPKSPDFKRKTTGEALWIDNSRTPEWVKERASQGETSEGGYQGEKVFVPNIEAKSELEKTWQAYFANPSDWWDNRDNKRNPRAPDFKHKSTGEALWIESFKNPAWVKSQLTLLDSNLPAAREDGRTPGFSHALNQPEEDNFLF